MFDYFTELGLPKRYMTNKQNRNAVKNPSRLKNKKFFGTLWTFYSIQIKIIRYIEDKRETESQNARGSPAGRTARQAINEKLAENLDNIIAMIHENE